MEIKNYQSGLDNFLAEKEADKSSQIREAECNAMQTFQLDSKCKIH